VDGDYATISGTEMNSGEFLQLELFGVMYQNIGMVYPNIGFVMVYNRRDVWAHLLGNVEVAISNEVSSPGTTTSGGTPCGPVQSYLPSHEPAPYVFDCSGVSGRFVTVKHASGGAGPISLAEVEPYVSGTALLGRLTPPPPPPSPAPSHPLGSPAPPPRALGYQPLTSAVMSSQWDAQKFPAQHVIDGDLTTICATNWAWGNWLTVGFDPLPSTHPSGTLEVEVYNRNDQYGYFLGTFEVWKVTGAGYPSDTAGGVKCGTAEFLASKGATPYVFSCPYVGGPGYITVALPSWTYLTIADVKIKA